MEKDSDEFDCKVSFEGSRVIHTLISTTIILQGTYTLTNARTSLQTISGPGWSSHLCGMNMERTGVTDNGWGPPWMGIDQPITPITGNSSRYAMRISGTVQHINR